MSNHSFESNEVLSAQVISPVRLHAARALLASVCETDAASINNSAILAPRLQGLSRAVSDIVLAKGNEELTSVRLSDERNPKSNPLRYTSKMLRHFENPETQTGRMFVAQPSDRLGASMTVDVIEEEGQFTKYDILLPTDQQIDRLLLQEPCFWEEYLLHTRDFRSGQANVVYPFHNAFYAPNAPQLYFGVLQELSSELLDRTA